MFFLLPLLREKLQATFFTLMKVRLNIIKEFFSQLELGKAHTSHHYPGSLRHHTIILEASGKQWSRGTKKVIFNVAKTK